MGLLPEINEEATESNVRDYFEKEFPRLVLQAGYSMLEVQSPKFDSIGGSGSNVRNSTEDKMINHFQAEKLVKATVRSIRHCPDIYRKILQNLYLKEVQDINVQMLLGYGHAQYNVLKNKSFLYFADSFQKTHDFHEYTNDDTVKWTDYV